ncbi:sugar transferase [Curtobacterium flaccumfaciens]|nr:sugar transferase [Curtobacterium flaccumfaciens]
MHVETPDYRRRSGKRVLDILGAGIGLLLLAPVFALVALVIRADDRGPVFFRQIRVGRGGQEFSILKFRTMCVDAEARMAALEQANEGAGPLFKMKNDPGSPASERSCGRRRSTSCRSCGTSSPDR